MRRARPPRGGDASSGPAPNEAGAEGASTSLAASLFPSEQRRPAGWLGVAISVVAIGLFAITIYWAFSFGWSPIEQRAGHLMVALPLTFLLYPAIRGRGMERPTLVDWLLAGLACTAFALTILDERRITERIPYFDPVTNRDLIVGTACILAVFEATRRTVGMPIVWINLFFITYALTGPYWPGVLRHRGTSYESLIESVYLLPGGLFNFILGLMVTFIFVFLALGVFLRASRSDRIFTDIAFALAGHRRGGPAKVAIIGSAFMGMLSGSSIGNVATTGAMTITMMKQVGFRPHVAAAIEATASVGGVLTPPIMGATIFILAEFTGRPLIEILAYSTAPAILYYVSLYFYVDIEARRDGLSGLPRDTLPRMGEVLKRGGHVFVPIAVLIGFLLYGYTPFWAGASCVLVTIAVSWLRPSTRLTPRRLAIASEGATRVALTLSALSASAAIIYAVLTITGLLVKVSAIILAFSGGSLFIAIVLIALMSYVLGMSLPVPAAYVLIAALGAPALVELGLSLFAAHLVIFWFSQDSTLTPPICMTAFAAARIADAPPMRTGFRCVLMAKALYIIPFVFAFGSLLDPRVPEIVFDAVLLCVVFAAMPLAVEGYWNGPIGGVARVVIAAAAILAFVGTMGDMAEGWPAALAALATGAVGWALVRRQVPAEE